MYEYLFHCLVFAQANGGATGGAPPWAFPLMLLVMIGIPYYLLLLRPNQKRERERKSMLAALKKNDHVVTIGGIKGVVANVKLEEDEVVLKVDEDSGTKLRVVMSSIARVVAAGEDGAGAKKES